MKTRPSGWRSLALLAGVVATLGLAACGGGGEDGTTGTADGSGAVPDSAFASADAFGSYVSTAASADMDTAEPLSLAGIEPPTSDTTEPVPLS